MSMDYSRTAYKVPAQRGGRVEYTHPVPPRMGTIVGTRGARLRIRLDGASTAEAIACSFAAFIAAISSSRRPIWLAR